MAAPLTAADRPDRLHLWVGGTLFALALLASWLFTGFVTRTGDQLERARALNPFYAREVFGRTALFFEGRPDSDLAPFGELRTPSIADLFVAKMQGATP